MQRYWIWTLLPLLAATGSARGEIRRAAFEVCEMPQGTMQLRIESEIKACRIGAADRAIVSANLPQLNALHLAKTGRNVSTGQYAGRQ